MGKRPLKPNWGKILGAINDGLVFIGSDGNITAVNRAFQNLLGYREEEIVGKPCAVLDCDACEGILKKEGVFWCKLFESGKSVRQYCIMTKKDGSYLPLLKDASIVIDEKGSITGAVEILIDISGLGWPEREDIDTTQQVNSENGFFGILGRSSSMQRVFKIVEKAARSDSPVIIYGESGTGKDLVARAIHRLGRRHEGPYVQFNCAALNESLLESELFGHVKGAFTGAYRHRIGRFEAAHGGDLFLDEIGDVPMSVQVKLLRVLETKQFERVGDHRTVSVDARIITATNKNLEELISQKKFREDLFFRINVLPIYIPPLRERNEDIPTLVNTFLRHFSTKTGKKINRLSKSAMEILMSYPWPGNVRELKSVIEYAFVITEDQVIGREELPEKIFSKKHKRDIVPFEHAERDAEEKEILIEALQKSKGNKSEAARMLGISRGTVFNRMRKYGIELKDVTFS